MAKRIMIIDDDGDHLELMALAMAGSGQLDEPDLCTSGAEALARLRACDDARLPALVLVDVRLGLESGFDVLRALKDDPRCSRIPVVMHSSSVDQRDVDQSSRLGASAYVVKKTSLGAMRSALQDVLKAWAP